MFLDLCCVLKAGVDIVIMKEKVTFGKEKNNFVKVPDGIFLSMEGKANSHR